MLNNLQLTFSVCTSDQITPLIGNHHVDEHRCVWEVRLDQFHQASDTAAAMALSETRARVSWAPVTLDEEADPYATNLTGSAILGISNSVLVIVDDDFLTPVPDGRYELRSFAVDEGRNNVTAYGVFRGTHTGEGGPVPPTGRRWTTSCAL